MVDTKLAQLAALRNTLYLTMDRVNAMAQGNLSLTIDRLVTMYPSDANVLAYLAARAALIAAIEAQGTNT